MSEGTASVTSLSYFVHGHETMVRSCDNGPVDTVEGMAHVSSTRAE